MKKVLVSGCNGTLGRLVCSAINSCEDMKVVAGFDKISNFKGIFPIYSELHVLFEINENIPDVIIDISYREATRSSSVYAYHYNIPIVVATTGLQPNDMYMLKREFSERIAVFQSTNFSFNKTLEDTKTLTCGDNIAAEGAVKAARFLMTKEHGFYTMDDLIASM